MSENEPAFLPEDAQYVVIAMANILFGIDYSNDQTGFELALSALNEQHARVQPPVSDQFGVAGLVVRQNPVIKRSEEKAATAVGDGDYGLALEYTNHLFVFGETDYLDSLGGRAFTSSLRVHLDFARLIVERFSANDPYLQVTGRRSYEEAKVQYDHGNFYQGLAQLRGLIHIAALAGTLGDAAKSNFDPYAIVRII